MIHFSFTQCSPGGITDDVCGWTFWSYEKQFTQFAPVCVYDLHKGKDIYLCVDVCGISSWKNYCGSLISQSVTCKSLQADVLQVGEHETADCECGKTLVNS